jgi:hypothetical protein
MCAQEILHTTLDLPVIADRDTVCMRAFRESPGCFEMMERSTTHPSAPPSGEYVRAYQFAYSRITEVGGDPDR